MSTVTIDLIKTQAFHSTWEYGWATEKDVQKLRNI